MVMKEFRAAVPESGFVLVAFENHFTCLPESVAFSKVFGDSTDEKCWLLAGRVNNPGQHCGGGGFSVRAADHNGVFAWKKHFFENFRHRTIRNFAFESFFELWISASDDVSDDNEIGRWSEMRGFERWKIGNAQTIEKRGCGRINSRVRAGDIETGFAQHSGERRHGRAADADDVDVFCFKWTGVIQLDLTHSMTAGSRISSCPSPSATSRARTPSGIVSMERAVWPMGAP